MVSSSVDAIAYMTCGDGFSLKDAEFEEWRIEKLLIWGFRVVGETPPPPPIQGLGSTSSTNPTILMISLNQ
jgi:hypothetical protein